MTRLGVNVTRDAKPDLAADPYVPTARVCRDQGHAHTLMQYEVAMANSGYHGQSALTLQSISDMRSSSMTFQRQLGCGPESDQLCGSRPDRNLAIGLRSQLSAISAFQQSVTSRRAPRLMQTRSPSFGSLSQQTSLRSCNRSLR